MNNNENLDPLIATMPFYGKVTVHLSNGALVGRQFRCYIPGRQPHIDGCLTCPPCPTGIGNQPPYSEEHLPLGTPVNMEYYKCENGQWIPFTTMRLVPQTQTHLDIQYFDGTHWRPLGYLEYFTQTPLSCGTLPTCQYITPQEMSFEIIPEATYTYPNTNTVENACTTGMSGGQLGGMIWANFHLPSDYTSSINWCVDGSNGRVNTNFNFECSKRGNGKIPIVLIYGLCENDGNSKHIFENFETYKFKMNKNNPNAFPFDSLCFLMEEIIGHYGSHVDNLGYQRIGKYVLQEVVLAHEMIHIQDYITEISDSWNNFLDDLCDYDFSCEEFINTPDPNVVAGQYFKNSYNAFMTNIDKRFKDYGKDKRENEIYTTQSQFDIVKKYYLVWRERIKAENSSCDISENFKPYYDRFILELKK